jgi:hypothetical protein
MTLSSPSSYKEDIKKKEQICCINTGIIYVEKYLEDGNSGQSL